MKSFLKYNLPLLAIVVAFFVTVAFTVHCDDMPFKYGARYLVKQKISSSGATSKIKTPLLLPFLVNIPTMLNIDISSFLWKVKILILIPISLFSGSAPPLRGPPSVIYF
jgi:hypothetical protein